MRPAKRSVSHLGGASGRVMADGGGVKKGRSHRLASAPRPEAARSVSRMAWSALRRAVGRKEDAVGRKKGRLFVER